MLENAALKEITAISYMVNSRDESLGIREHYGKHGMLLVMGRMFVVYARNPAYRKFVKGLRKGGVAPDNLPEYFGSGMFAGRK